MCHGDGVLHTFAHVVGIDEERTVVGARARESTERLELGIEAHHPAVRVRAEDRNAVLAPGKDVRGARAAGHVARAGHGHAAIGSLSSAQAELRYRASLRRLDHARSLCCHERLEANRVKKRRLEHLALERRAAHAHHGLAREHELALGHGVDIHMHTEVAQVVEEAGLEQRTARRRFERPKVGDVLVGEAKVLHQIGQVGGAAHHRVRAPKGMVAVECGEAILLVHLAALPEPLGHGELVEVREERYVRGARFVRQSHVDPLPFLSRGAARTT